MKKFIFVLLTVVLSFTGFGVAFAGTGNGMVTSLQVWDTAWVTFSLENHPSYSCGANSPKFLFSLNDSHGKAFLALLMNAKNAGTEITVWGSGQCVDLYGNGTAIMEKAGMVAEGQF